MFLQVCTIGLIHHSGPCLSQHYRMHITQWCLRYTPVYWLHLVFLHQSIGSSHSSALALYLDHISQEGSQALWFRHFSIPEFALLPQSQCLGELLSQVWLQWRKGPIYPLWPLPKLCRCLWVCNSHSYSLNGILASAGSTSRSTALRPAARKSPHTSLLSSAFCPFSLQTI